jgi:uncharacterized protein YukE
MRDTVSALSYSIRSLSSSWQGGAAENFIDEADQVLLRIQQHLEELDILSQRTVREVRQWVDTDTVKSSYSDFFGNFSLSLDDAKYLFAGGYLATHLRWSPLRPNSMIFTGPNWMRETVGIKEMTRVIKPTTLVKQMALLAYAANVVEGAGAGIDTYNDSRYAGTNRAMPAAVLDGLVKTAILAGGTTLLVGATALITTISAPAVVVGGAVILTWVVGGFVLDKFVQTPLWDSWQSSYQRDQAIESVTRYANDAKNFVQQKLKDDAQTIKNAFGGFISGLLPSAP